MGKRKKTAGSKNLPIFLYKSLIMQTIKNNPVVIITGQTGCGKSTQVPKYLFEAGFSKNGIIASLHPRCIAAMSLAERVSHEFGTEIGTRVGYHVRFHRKTLFDTRIMFMTMGLMLQTMKYSTNVDKYSVIIIDEAHERSIQIDLVFGLMKEILGKNHEIKLVIMSASLDVQTVREYYGNCPLIDVSKAVDQVEVVYRPVAGTNYLAAIKSVVLEILQNTKTGHILIFLQSEEKVRKCRKLLTNLPKTKSLAFFASMDNDEKQAVFFNYNGRRKIIVSTNVAETSLTIPGVDFVIDSGLVKRVTYDHETGVEKWMTKNVSIAEANQRKGRTGRTGKGKCYRMYDEKCVTKAKDSREDSSTKAKDSREDSSTKAKDSSEDSMDQSIASINGSSESDEEQMELCIDLEKLIIGKEKEPERFLDYPEPEILKVNLSSMVMAVKAIGRNDVMAFPFIVAPDPENVKKSEQSLRDLSLLQESGVLTNLGKEVCKVPLEPHLGKVAIIASQLPCRSRVFATICMLAVRNVLKSPTQFKEIHQSFCCGHGDLFQLANIFFEARSNWFSREWCSDNAIEFASMKYASRVFNQLEREITQPRFDYKFFQTKNNENLMKKVFLSGLFRNIAVHEELNKYSIRNQLTASLHKTTTVDKAEPIIMFLSLNDPTGSKNLVIRYCTNLNKEMLVNFNPSKYGTKTSLWKKILQEQIQP